MIVLIMSVLLQQPFEWNVTDVAPLDASRAMHRLSYGTDSDRGLVAATHIGRGFFVTCGHMMRGRTGTFELDGERVDAEYVADLDIDFVLVRVIGHEGPAAEWTTREVWTGQRLTVIGRLTGRVTGVVHETAATDGTRKISVDDYSPVTQSGDSGSPVIDADGRIVGVHVALLNGERSTRLVPLSIVKDLMMQPFNGTLIRAR